MSYLHNICSEYLHSCNVGSLFLYINRAHIDITFKPEVCSCGCKCHPVLTCARFCDDLFLAHILCEQRLAHAVIELMGAGMVEVLALCIELNVAKARRESFKVGNGGGSALKLLAYSAQLADESSRFADSKICLGYLIHRILKLGSDKRASEFAEIPVFVGIIFKVCFKIDSVEFHFLFLFSYLRCFFKLKNQPQRHRL